MMKKITVFLLAAATFISYAPQANAGIFSKKKQTKATTAKIDSTAKKKVTPYDKLFKDKQKETAKSNFITLHKVGGKLYFEIPQKYLNREMLFASTPSEVTTEGFVDIGYKPNGAMVVKFTKKDSTISLRAVYSTSTLADETIKPALSKVNGDPILYSYPIKAYTSDSSAVVIDMTTLFTTNVKMFDFMPSDMGGGLIKVSAAFKKDESSLDEIKAFSNNISIKSIMSYSVSMNFLGMMKLMDDYPFTVKVTRSFMLLPENKMTPRISDSRVGIFNNTKTLYTLTKDKVESYSVAHRWRVEPKDVAAYKRGELVEPTQQIVYYVDNTFPELWKQPIKEGIERWNASFEKIGFKNVIVAKDFPTTEEDPEFDPDNLKYSCVRYLPSPTPNAMGPSWVDPETGEILNASVLVYSNIIQLINSWRFVQTAQIDPRVRTTKMPDDIIKESIGYVVAHEIGHTLGFMHNMAASAAFPVDSLRSASFTKLHGTTPCIMDYARFNYVAQPEDKGVRITPPDLGVYDHFLVKWTYQYLPDTKDEYTAQAITESWVDEHVGDPVYRYGRQQIRSMYDPSALTEDLGDDPIKAGNYGVKNLKYILAHLEEWITDDDDYSHTESLHRQIVSQYMRYIFNVSYNIGGIYLNEVKRGTQANRHEPVSKSVQKASLNWILNEFRNMSWVDNASLKEKYPLKVDFAFTMYDRVAKNFKNQIDNVVLTSKYSSTPYTVEEIMNDLYAATWYNLLNNKKLTDGDKILQKAMVSMFCEPFAEKKQGSGGLPLGTAAYVPSVDEIILYNMDETGVVERYADMLRAYEEEHGRGTIAMQMFKDDNRFGTPGYGFPSKVNTGLIDNSVDYMQLFAIRSRDLLKSRIPAATGDAKAHYQALLIKLNTALKDKL